MMRTKKVLIILLSACFLFTSACVLSDLGQATPSAPADPGASGTQEPTPVSEHLDERLDGLKSYRATLTMKFAGQDKAGKQIFSSLEVIEELNRDQDTHHLLSHSDLVGERPGSVDIYQTGARIYMVSSEDQNKQSGCTLLTPDKLAGRTKLTLRPTDLYASLWRGKLVALDEQLPEYVADHYTLGGADLRLGSPEKISGDLWFSKDRGYILRFSGSAEGILSLGFGTTYGKIDWEYNLSQINQVNLNLPSDCAALAQNDLPLAQDAFEVTQNGAELAFQTAAAPAATLEFLRAELIKRGWTIQNGAAAGATSVTYAVKDQQALVITITPLASGSQVILLRK